MPWISPIVIQLFITNDLSLLSPSSPTRLHDVLHVWRQTKAPHAMPAKPGVQHQRERLRLGGEHQRSSVPASEAEIGQRSVWSSMWNSEHSSVWTSNRLSSASKTVIKLTQTKQKVIYLSANGVRERRLGLINSNCEKIVHYPFEKAPHRMIDWVWSFSEFWDNQKKSIPWVRPSNRFNQIDLQHFPFRIIRLSDVPSSSITRCPGRMNAYSVSCQCDL